MIAGEMLLLHCSSMPYKSICLRSLRWLLSGKVSIKYRVEVYVSMKKSFFQVVWFNFGLIFGHWNRLGYFSGLLLFTVHQNDQDQYQGER